MGYKPLVALGAGLVLTVAAAAFLHRGGPSVSILHHGTLLQHGNPNGPGASPTGSAAANGAVRAARARVAALGNDWSTEVAIATGAIYAELRGSGLDTGIERTNEIHYGPDALQTLDLFIPEGGFSELTTVLVYLHGDALAPSGDNVAASIASVGGIGVLARYRNGPDVRWPAGAEDVRLLLSWVQANIEQHGGDPRLVVLMGNSTGATRIAEYLFDERQQLPDSLGIAAAVLSSGIFDASFGEELSSYYASAPAAAPLAQIERYMGRNVPLLLWSAEHDPPQVRAGVAELFAKLCRRQGDCPAYEELAGANHVSHVLSLGSPDTAAADVLFRFYHGTVN